LEKSPKWPPYGVALRMALMGIFFEKPIGVVMKPEVV